MKRRKRGKNTANEEETTAEENKKNRWDTPHK